MSRHPDVRTDGQPELARRLAVRTAAVMTALSVLTTLLAAATSAPAEAAPPTRVVARAIEAFSPYQPQTTCSPTAKPGVVAFSRTVLAAYRGTGSYGIVRACRIGGRSEHKEGRAWDWRVSYRNPTQRAQAQNMINWLLATDRYGNKAANARRTGINYMIWNKRIWSSYTRTWRVYRGSNPHTEHIHFTFSWAGAQKRTSYWTGRVAPVVRPPVPPKPPVVPPPAPVVTPPAPRPSDPKVPVVDEGVQQVFVPATNRSGITTPYSLTAGRRYELVSKGTYDYGVGMQADAECSRWPSDQRWRRVSAWESDSRSGHLDLMVGGAAQLWYPERSDSNGCDTQTHTYRLVFVAGADAPLRLKINDDNYGDNSGGLSVVVRPLDAGVAPHD